MIVLIENCPTNCLVSYKNYALAQYITQNQPKEALNTLWLMTYLETLKFKVIPLVTIKIVAS